MGKTQLKSTKVVLVSNKILELWVKLPVSDHGSIWLGFLNWNYSFVSKSISLHPKIEILAKKGSQPKKPLLYVKAKLKSTKVGFASTHNLENHGCWSTNCTHTNEAPDIEYFLHKKIEIHKMLMEPKTM